MTFIVLSDSTCRLFTYKAQGANRLKTVDHGAGDLNAATDGILTTCTYDAITIYNRRFVN